MTDQSSSLPAHLPPLPAGTCYGGQLKDHDGHIEGYIWHPGCLDGKWSHGDDRPLKWSGMANQPDGESSNWHIAIPQSSSPPVDARVACAESNNACAAGASKSDDPGRGGFSPSIEADWLRYTKYQEARLSDAGERYPHVLLLSDGEGIASSLLTPNGQETRAVGIDAAVTKRIKLLSKHGPDLGRREKIAKLEAELASLKGEGGGL